MTLIGRTPSIRRYNLRLLWSIRGWIEGNPEGCDDTIQFLYNIVLFIPLGFSLKMAKNIRLKTTVIIAVLLSGVIEFIQYFGKIGLAEIDDVISNTVGAIIGFVMFNVIRKI